MASDSSPTRAADPGPSAVPDPSGSRRSVRASRSRRRTPIPGSCWWTSWRRRTGGSDQEHAGAVRSDVGSATSRGCSHTPTVSRRLGVGRQTDGFAQLVSSPQCKHRRTMTRRSMRSSFSSTRGGRRVSGTALVDAAIESASRRHGAASSRIEARRRRGNGYTVPGGTFRSRSTAGSSPALRERRDCVWVYLMAFDSVPW